LLFTDEQGQIPQIGRHMNYGIQISASGALAGIHQQDALTNNLANVNTIGFKPILTGTMQRLAARAEDNLGSLNSDAMLEKLGGGVFAAPTRINFAQGTLESSEGNAFDMAIEGNGFFVVGDSSTPSLTRDGRFTLSIDNELVMASSGTPVLSVSNSPIHIDPEQGPIIVGADGVITQGGAPIDQIQIADVNDRSTLMKIGEGLFGSQTGSPLNLTEATGMLRQFMLEGSGVSEISALMKIQSASKSAQGNIGMIDLQNRLMDRAINTFGRIA
jgi:flagellar basal-body rod protein FlgF